jgi:hypothetical protein
MRTVLRHKEPPLWERRRVCIAFSWRNTVTSALAGFLDVVGRGEDVDVTVLDMEDGL